MHWSYIEIILFISIVFLLENVAHDAFFSSLLMMDSKNIYSQRLLPSFILGYRYHYVSNFQVWIKYQTENNPPRHWTHFSFFHFQSRKRNIGNWNGSINLYWVFSATTQTFLPIPQKTKRVQKRIGCEKRSSQVSQLGRIKCYIIQRDSLAIFVSSRNTEHKN